MKVARGPIARRNSFSRKLCGNEPALARSVVGFAAGPPNLSIAVQYDEKFEARLVGGAIAEAGVLGAFRREIRARGQQRTCAALRGQSDARNSFYNAAVEVGDGKRFFEVKFARLAGRIGASVIVNAIREVRILLHFEDDHAWANRVRNFCRDKKRVTRLNRVPLKKIFKSLLFQ